MDDLATQAAALSREAPRQFARWDAGLFAALVAGPAAALDAALAGEADAEMVRAAYLRLVLQGVGTGAVRRAAAGPAGWSGFLERCLVEHVPALLPAVPVGERAGLLVRVWNLGEGLRREPAWLDRYAAARAADLDDLADVEGFLVRALEPVLAPAPPAAWRGPFAVTVLDLRPWHDSFLPGEVTLAGPTVLRVDDRRLPDVQAAVLLRPGGRSEVLGLTAGMGEYAEPDPGPIVTFYDGRLTIGPAVVDLPALRECHRHTVARAGFVVASAVDSQRLWIVEGP